MHTGKNNRQNTNKNQQTKPGERNRDNKSLKKRPEGEKKRIQHCKKEKTNKYESMKAYIQSQAKLKEGIEKGIEKEHRENIRDLVKKSARKEEQNHNFSGKKKGE